MWIDFSDHFHGSLTVDEALVRCWGLERQPSDGDPEYEPPVHVLALEKSKAGVSGSIDLQYLHEVYEDDKQLARLFDCAAGGTGGWLSRDQLIQFTETVMAEVLNAKLEDLSPRPEFFRQRAVTPIQPMVTFETLHHILRKSNLTVSREHTKLHWLFLCHYVYGGRIVKCIPLHSLFDVLTFTILQPRLADGRLTDWRVMWTNVDYFSGSLDFEGFLLLLHMMDITLKREGALAMWRKFVKDAIDISDYLPNGFGEIWLRPGQGRRGLDPLAGYFVTVATVYRVLPKYLMTGLWPEALRALVSFSLQKEINAEQLAAATRIASSNHPFKLVGLADAGKVLTALSVEGMSFRMLEASVSQMRLELPPGTTRKMFALMDINQDKTLDLFELLRGFEVLFSQFIPPLIIRAVAADSESQLKSILRSVGILVALAMFVYLAFSALTASKADSNSTAIQSLLAVVSAYTLQSSAQKSEREVLSGMRQRMEDILGEGLTKRLEEQVAIETVVQVHDKQQQEIADQQQEDRALHKGITIHYNVPARFLISSEVSPKPAIWIRTEDTFVLVPVISGGHGITDVVWRVKPQFPRWAGLRLDPHSGTISLFGRTDELAVEHRQLNRETDAYRRRTFTVACTLRQHTIAKTRLSFVFVASEDTGHGAFGVGKT